MSTDENTPKKKRSSIVAPKTRGSAKLVATKSEPSLIPVIVKTNVILTLKCSLKDLLDYTNSIAMTPEEQTIYNLNQHIVETSGDFKPEPTKVGGFDTFQPDLCPITDTKDVELAVLNEKLRKLKIDLYIKLSNKSSSCFWCTSAFNNLPCFIPRYETNSCIQVYSNFCCPECALAYLLKEDIDDSVKFERVQLLNRMYRSDLDEGFNRAIRPAPSPYYLLDKFFGSLTIQEFRRLNKTTYNLVLLDKPLSKQLPELHDLTNDNGQYGSRTGNYRVKRASDMGSK